MPSPPEKQKRRRCGFPYHNRFINLTPVGFRCGFKSVSRCFSPFPHLYGQAVRISAEFSSPSFLFLPSHTSITARVLPGQSVIMPSTPHETRNRTADGSLTVHTLTLKPSLCAIFTKSGETNGDAG